MQTIHYTFIISFIMKSNTRRSVIIAFVFSIAQLISGQDFSELENWSCSRPGLNSHPHDCHNFVLCISTQEGLKPESIFTCPQSFAFSSQEKTCVHQDKVPGCTQNRQGTGDEDDGFSKRGPVGRSCKSDGVFCHNNNVLVVCTDTRVPVLVLDCRTLDDTPICDTIKGTCTAENLPDHITFKDPDITEEEEEVVEELEDKIDEVEVEPETAGEQEQVLPVLENTIFPSTLSATLAKLIERVMGVFTRRIARLNDV